MEKTVRRPVPFLVFILIEDSMSFDANTSEQTQHMLQSPSWHHFYVGSIPLPDNTALSEASTGSPTKLSTRQETEGSLSHGLAQDNQAQHMHGSREAIKQGLATMGSKFDLTTLKASRKFRKDLPSLLEKSYTFSPAGLRPYGLGSSSSQSELESVSFLEHLRFLLDGKVEAALCDPNHKDLAAKPVKEDLDDKPNRGSSHLHVSSSVIHKPKPSPKPSASAKPTGEVPKRKVLKNRSQYQQDKPGRRSHDSTKVEVDEPPAKIMLLSRIPPTVPFNRQRLILAMIFVLSFGLLGRAWQSFFNSRRSPVARNQNATPTLTGDFYSAAVTHSSQRQATLGVHKGAFQIESNTVQYFIRRLSSSSSSSSSSVQVDVISISSPFVATRSRKPLPDRHGDPKGRSVIKKVIRPIILPFVSLYRLGQKILRAVISVDDWPVFLDE
jgi:hypothetical protein